MEDPWIDRTMPYSRCQTARHASAGRADIHGDMRKQIFTDKMERKPPSIPSSGNGGARRDRTDDLMLAKHALSQLSYGPKLWLKAATRERDAQHDVEQETDWIGGGPGTTRTSDLTLIRGAL